MLVLTILAMWILLICWVCSGPMLLEVMIKVTTEDNLLENVTCWPGDVESRQ